MWRNNKIKKTNNMRQIIGKNGWSVNIEPSMYNPIGYNMVDVKIYHNGHIKACEICVHDSDNYATQVNNPDKFLTHLMK